MGQNAIIGLIGRRLRLGLVGGGGTSMIGPVHRMAARLDDHFEIVAGVLSSHAERSFAEAAKLGIPRAYGSPQSMFETEAERSDGVDMVAVMTPDDTHAAYSVAALDAGLDVICDKPISNDLAGALRVEDAARRSGNLFCLTHNYSGFPMVREARAAVAAGEFGRIQLVQVTYLMGSLATRVEDNADTMPDRLKWRLDPQRGGRSHVLADIGTHAHHLAVYVAGDAVSSVFADLGAAVEGRAAHDTASVLFRTHHGARGVLFASKAAAGARGGITLEVFGETGGLHWTLANPGELRVLRPGQSDEIRAATSPTLHPLARRSLRGIGGAGAFVEAFANLYSDFGHLVAARIAGVDPDPLAAQVPGLADGLEGMRFIDACLASSERRTWADLGAPVRS